MKLLPKLALMHCFCFATFPALAENPYDYTYAKETSGNTKSLVDYLKNLGSGLGYDITKVIPPENKSLLNLPGTQLAETYLFSTFFGSIPVASLLTGGGTKFQFVSSNMPGAGSINDFANATFNYQRYNSPSGQQSTVAVNPLIDQPTYQADPVSQSILNILGTPDTSYCMDTDGNWVNSCQFLFQNQVMANIIGPIPDPRSFFSYNYNQQLISQLNSNSLLAPLFYSTDETTTTTGSPNPNNQQNPGLTAQNQAQQAANFIRYASGSVLPVSLPSLNDYTKLFLQAVPPKGSDVPIAEQKQAQATLSNYFNSLRVYAAQSSVGVSNLYYILSKRLPQTPTGDKKKATSQAMSEFQMATWRLFAPTDPNNPQKQQWIEQINGASTATVQKEIAVLLAEINYQMYLDRQLQERILLTQTITLMQNTKAGQPTADFANSENKQGAKQ